MELNNLLKLDLKEHCLFCLKPATLQNVDEEENTLIQFIFEQPADGKFNSFQRFFWKVLSGSSLNGGQEGEKGGEDLLVCRKCVMILKEIKRLHSNLEITQMLLVEKVKDLQMVIKNTSHGGMEDVEGLSFSGLEKFKNFQENVFNHGQTRMKIPMVFLGHVNGEKIADSFRNSTSSEEDSSSEEELDFGDLVFGDSQQSPISPSYEAEPLQTSFEEAAVQIKHEVSEFGDDLIEDSVTQNKNWDSDWMTKEDGTNSTDDANEEKYLPPKRQKYSDHPKTEPPSDETPIHTSPMNWAGIERAGSSIVLRRAPSMVFEPPRTCDLKIETTRQRKRKRDNNVRERIKDSAKTKRKLASTVRSSTHPKNSAEVKKARSGHVWRRIPNMNSEHSQICDLCYDEVPSEEILSHLQGHVKDYAVSCMNPKCPRVFSCKVKWRFHIKHDKSDSCRNYVEAKGISMEMKCPVCEFKATHLTAFWGHLNVHELAVCNKQMSCPIPDCSEKFALRETADLHIFSCHDLSPPSSKQTCSICKVRILVAKMPEHLMEAHQVLEPVKCKQCPFVFSKKEDHIDHLFENHKNDLFGATCDICEDGIKIFHLKSFRKHYLNVHQIGTEDTSTVICEYCSLEFSRIGGLINHKRSAHFIEDPRNPKKRKHKSKGYPCSICPQKYFPSNASLLTHNIACHGADQLKCNVCGESFSDANKLRRHVRNHAGLNQVKQKVWKCESSGCDKVFGTSKGLHTHHQREHSNPTGEVFTCDRCGKEYSTEMKLKCHVKDAHAKAAHVCETCGESFKNTTILKRHKLIHTGERRHICPICGQAFRTRDVMGRHIKAHEQKGDTFKPNGPMKQIRKRVAPK